ncbi:hypothetical protein PENTCL1PPCAC_4063, partial [Pristionchus entomophagus]
AMSKIVEAVLDYLLLIAESYLLIRIALSKNPYFKSSFFFFFIITGSHASLEIMSKMALQGALGCLSNVGFFIITRNLPLADRAWLFTFGSILLFRIINHLQLMNAFGALGSTIGKLYIVAHRYAVMRSVNLMENIWSNRLTAVLTGILLILTFIRSIHVFFCEYVFTIR